MFNLFRSQKKVVRLLLGGILSAVALSMVITLIPGLMTNPNEIVELVLGEVDGRPITAQTVATHMRSQGVPPDLPLNSIVLSSAGAVNTLTEREVLLMEAEKFGLFPDDQEVADWLKFQMPMLFPNGVFVGTAPYAQFVRQNYSLSVPEFERQLALSMAVDTRLRRLVTSNIVISNDELLAEYRGRNQQAKIEFIKVSPGDLTSQVRITAEELRARYEQEKSRHRIPEERTVKVLTVDAARLPAVEIPEARLRQYYSRNRVSYRLPAQARASHILFTLEPGEEENSEKEAKANEVLQKIRDGADFVAMAKEHSEDVANADNGGDLGWFNEGEYPEAFEEAALALEPDVISEVVKSIAGYHIIKLHEREDGRTQPFDEVRDQILGALRAETSQADHANVINEITAAAREAGSALESVGVKYDFEVQTFDPFNINDPPPQIAGDQVFINTLFTTEPGTPATSNQDGVTKIGVVTALVPMRLAEFDEVRDTVRQSLLEQKAQDLAQQRAAQIGEAALEPGASLRRVASRFGARVRTSALFKSTDMIDDLGQAGELGAEPFQGELNVVVGPRQIGDNFAIFRAIERAEADMSRFEDQRENIRRSQLGTRVNAEFRVYAEGKVAEYEAAGRVHKYEDRVRDFAELYTRSRN
jgi:peptidyl-prolyl cis-trans isomerase D